MFQITIEEWGANSSQIVMTSNRPITALPFAFTEQGIAMLSGVLKSDVAIAAIGQLAEKIEEKKKKPMARIGFK